MKKQPVSTDISLIIPGFSSAFKAPQTAAPELTKPVPSTIVPPEPIWSYS
jgi:hypothetical protein